MPKIDVTAKVITENGFIELDNVLYYNLINEGNATIQYSGTNSDSTVIPLHSKDVDQYPPIPGYQYRNKIKIQFSQNDDQKKLLIIIGKEVNIENP